MIYVKSVLAGFVALATAAVLLPVIAIVVVTIYSWIHPSPVGSGYSLDLISLVGRSLLPPTVVIVIVFASGFLWEFRRLTRR